MFLAVEIEMLYSKEEILTMYANPVRNCLKARENDKTK